MLRLAGDAASGDGASCSATLACRICRHHADLRLRGRARCHPRIPPPLPLAAGTPCECHEPWRREAPIPPRSSVATSTVVHGCPARAASPPLNPRGWPHQNVGFHIVLPSAPLPSPFCRPLLARASRLYHPPRGPRTLPLPRPSCHPTPLTERPPPGRTGRGGGVAYHHRGGTARHAPSTRPSSRRREGQVPRWHATRVGHPPRFDDTGGRQRPTLPCLVGDGRESTRHSRTPSPPPLPIGCAATAGSDAPFPSCTPLHPSTRSPCRRPIYLHLHPLSRHTRPTPPSSSKRARAAPSQPM